MKKQSIPNYLTYARAAAIPVVLILMLLSARWVPLALFAIFVAASITDFLDGYLARKWNATSAIGALLDPIADKLLVAAMLLFILTHSISLRLAHGGILRMEGAALLLPSALILLREIYISGLREFLAARGKTLPVSKGGKLKTALQMLAITLLLLCFVQPLPLLWQIGGGLLWLAALVAIATAVDYTRKAKAALTNAS